MKKRKFQEEKSNEGNKRLWTKREIDRLVGSSMVLAAKQRQALDTALAQRRNLFLTGQAGTGKSAVIKKIAQAFEEGKLDDVLGITAFTGAASVLIQGVTLHSWLGAGLFNGSVKSIVNGIKGNGAKWRKWKQAQTLVIDEMSMVPIDMFHKVNQVAQGVRNNELPFGGLQVIACADFFQLPPVYRDEDIQPLLDKYGTLHIFETDLWKELFPVTISLDQIFRQTDPQFIALLSRARRGGSQLTLEDRKMLLSRVITEEQEIELLKREIPPTELHTRRVDVEEINLKKLRALEPNEKKWKVYEAQLLVDSKLTRFETTRAKSLHDSYEKTRAAPSTLNLVVGAPVMLTWNLEVKAGLCNGSQGVVIDFVKLKDDPVFWPKVRFVNNLERVIGPVDTMLWKSKGRVMASDRQVPLRLAWALTIYKSQGATLDSVLSSLDRRFQIEHQFYVMLSRCKTLEGLNLRKCDFDAIIANPKVIAYQNMLDGLAGAGDMV